MRTRLLIVIICLLLSFSGFSQQPEYPQENIDNQGFKENTTQVIKLFELGKEVSNENYQEGTEVYRKALQLALRIDHPFWIARTQESIGVNYANTGQLDSSLHYTALAESGYEKLANQKRLAKIYLIEQYVRKRQGKYEKSLEAALKALAIYEQIQDQEGKAAILGKIGSLFYWMEKWEACQDYTEQAYRLADQEGFGKEKAYASRLLGDLWEQLEDYEKALTYQEDALLYYQQNNDKVNIANTLTSIGNSLKQLGRSNEAFEKFQQSLQLYEELGTVVMAVAARHQMALLLMEKRDFEQVRKLSLQNLKASRELGQIPDQKQIYQILAAAYADLNIYDSAYYFYKTYKSISDSLLNVENTNRISELQITFESEKKDAEIITQAQRIRDQNMSIVLGIIILFGVVIGGIYLFHLNRKLQQRNAEKEVLLKEIHHRVKNNLQFLSSLLSLQTRYIQDPGALDAVNEGKNRVQAMSLIHQKLYTGDELTGIQMKDYLKALGDNLMDSLRMPREQVYLHYDVEPILLDVDTAIPLGLIINEGITNALKYAFPKGRRGNIMIRLWEEDEILNVVLEDDGVGIKQAPKRTDSTNFGSSLIQLLSKKLKGKMEISDEEGTRMAFRFERYKKY
jgi:two-component sensor histidine kinase